MKLLSATDLAIAAAVAANTIRVIPRAGRYGAFWTIEDQHGMIEVALSEEEAQQRIASIREALRTKQVA